MTVLGELRKIMGDEESKGGMRIVMGELRTEMGGLRTIMGS